MRFELYPVRADLDVHAKRIASDFIRENPGLDPRRFEISTAKAYEISTESDSSSLETFLGEILLNPVLETRVRPDAWKATAKQKILVRRFRPGMTDNAARTLEEAVSIRSPGTTVVAHRLDLFRISTDDANLLARLESFLWNPMIHALSAEGTGLSAGGSPAKDSVGNGKSATSFRALSPAPLFAIRELGATALSEASKKNLWALSQTEMLAIQAHFRELGRDPRIAEMEVLAQTWSEHCKHKIFRGTIHYREERTETSGPMADAKIPATTRSLFRSTIKAATDASPKAWLLSVFSDNAGIVAFTPEDAVCIKVETHNSPSAIDPFAGAITGIGGVHRDIIGTGYGAKPIFNLDAFCVAPARFDADRPDGIFPPSRVLEGVRAGVEAGGNPAGIPTIAGALVYDESYLGKPLVFCGSGGVLPRRLAAPVFSGESRDCAAKEIVPGDAIVMVGGRIGRDGIHGATFSSLAMDGADTGLGSVVQLGDPFTQKRALDFLLVARDRGLYRTLTDNGAGGLSSSVGELATLSNGARLDLTNAPLKAVDLRPEEILVSESQERMSLAVPPSALSEFLALSREMGVESTALGEFTASGRFEVLYRGETVADLSLEFLHEGCPNLELEAVYSPGPVPALAKAAFPTTREALVELLGSDNIASKESLLRQYDHEVQGGSVVKPQTQIGEHRSPNQSAAVLLRPDSEVAAVVGVGILPEYSRYDAYVMAEASLDEAVRNVLASGAEYGTEDSVLALLDNFCWPDPVSNSRFAADLVRAGYGLRDSAMSLRLPFVSGKDSMKNDFRGTKNGQPVRISVNPTVLVTALGRLPNLERARTSEFKSAGDSVFLLGPGRFSLLGSQFERIGLVHGESRELPRSDWELAKKVYSWLGSEKSIRLRSCADVSEGGIAVAIAEGLFAYQLGFEFAPDWRNDAELSDYFGEGFHSFVVSCRAHDSAGLTREWFEQGIPFVRLGTTTDRGTLELPHGSIRTSELELAWKGKNR